MDTKKIGKFLFKLRTNKGWSQEDIAKKLSISRESISKWERGVTLPSFDNAKRLSEIYNVDIKEIMYGAKKTTENKSQIENIEKTIYDENNNKNAKIKKMKLLLTMLLFAVVILTILLLGYYFISNYGKTKMYTVGSSDKNIHIEDAIIIKTRERIYINLGTIRSDTEISYLTMYYIDKNNNYNLVIGQDGTQVILHDYLGYNHYFEFQDLDHILNNLYLEITDLTGTKTVKLETREIMSNKNFFAKKLKPMTNGETLTEPNYDKELEAKIKKLFKDEGKGVYTYFTKTEKFTYFENSKSIILDKEGEYNKEWQYYLNSNSLIYQEYKNEEKPVNFFCYIDQEIKCNISNCYNEKEEINNFYKALQSIFPA